MSENMDAIDGKEALLPYYVYLLLNPLDNNKVFYVGKGTGQRAGSHNRDVERLLREEKREILNIENNEENEPPPTLEQRYTEKVKIIMGIKDSNISPLEVIVGRYKTEEEAYAVEATLIHFMFGYENLTNVASGHGSKYIRTKDDFDNIRANARTQADIPSRPGIDEEKIKNSRTNEFKDKKINELENAHTYDFLSDLQDSLTNLGFNWRNFTKSGDKRFHPGESNGYLATIVKIGPIDFNLQFTKSKEISIQYLFTRSPEEEDVGEALRRLEVACGVKLGSPKANMKYAWLEPLEKYNKISSLLDRLEQFKKAIETQQTP
jgi:hypothetical protein